MKSKLIEWRVLERDVMIQSQQKDCVSCRRGVLAEESSLVGWVTSAAVRKGAFGRGENVPKKCSVTTDEVRGILKDSQDFDVLRMVVMDDVWMLGKIRLVYKLHGSR